MNSSDIDRIRSESASALGRYLNGKVGEALCVNEDADAEFAMTCGSDVDFALLRGIADLLPRIASAESESQARPICFNGP
jgi:hypothetical protein